MRRAELAEWAEVGRDKGYLGFKAGDVKMAGVFYVGKAEALGGWDEAVSKNPKKKNPKEKYSEKDPEEDQERHWEEKLKISWLKKMACMTASLKGVTESEVVEESFPLTFGPAEMFPTKRRPVSRSIDVTTDEAVVEEWLSHSGVHLWDGLNGDEAGLAKRLLYTWSTG